MFLQICEGVIELNDPLHAKNDTSVPRADGDGGGGGGDGDSGSDSARVCGASGGRRGQSIFRVTAGCLTR